jgi:hypothetical protein
MRYSAVARGNVLWLTGLACVACAGRAVDSSAPDSSSTGGNGGGQSTDGSVAGASVAGGTPMGGTGGAGGRAGSDGSGGSTVGGGSTGGVGGSGGSAGSAGGAAGSTAGSSGSAGGSPCSTGDARVRGPAEARSVGFSPRAIERAGGLGRPDLHEAGLPCYCTRRPGPGVSFQCPAGIDESATAIIGPAGGTVSLMGRQGIGSGAASMLTVSPKTFERDVAVVITETSIPPPANFTDWSPIYELEPACIRTSSLMKLKLPHSNKSGAVFPPAFTLYFAKDRNGPFTAVADAYQNAGFFEAGITEFGFFLIALRNRRTKLAALERAHWGSRCDRRPGRPPVGAVAGR